MPVGLPCTARHEALLEVRLPHVQVRLVARGRYCRRPLLLTRVLPSLATVYPSPTQARADKIGADPGRVSPLRGRAHHPVRGSPHPTRRDTQRLHRPPAHRRHPPAAPALRPGRPRRPPRRRRRTARRRPRRAPEHHRRPRRQEPPQDPRRRPQLIRNSLVDQPGLTRS